MAAEGKIAVAERADAPASTVPGVGSRTVFAVALAVVAADQATKFAARRFLTDGSVPVVPGFFSLSLVFNRGAAWGMMQGFRYGFLALAVAMVGFLAFRWRQVAGPGRLAALSSALLIGGIVGNAIDRAVFGCVTDFIDLWHGTYHFPCFNVADSAICIGVALYFLTTLSAARNPGTQP